MSKHYDILPVICLDSGTTYSHPPMPPEVAHIDDPAWDVMVDLTHAQAATIAPESPLTDAMVEMKGCGSDLLLVVNKRKVVTGLIGIEDILGEKPLKISQERRIHRSDILVRMVLTPRAEIIVFNYEALRHARVGHLVATLHKLKQHYALVVDVDERTEKQVIRGFYSLSKIGKELSMDVTSDISVARSLAELQHDLKA